MCPIFKTYANARGIQGVRDVLLFVLEATSCCEGGIDVDRLLRLDGDGLRMGSQRGDAHTPSPNEAG